MTITFTPDDPWQLGLLPDFFSEDDPRTARQQLHGNYAHGGGFHEFKGFTLYGDPTEAAPLQLLYPHDPPTKEVARARLRDELIVLFRHGWVAIIQPDGSMEVARID